MTQQQQSTQDTVRSIYNYAGSLMKSNVSDDLIHGKLVERGISSEAAKVVITNLRIAKRRVARKDMLVGAAFCIVGAVVTITTMTAASSTHGRGVYVVAWGAIIFGALQFFRGLGRYVR